MIRSVIALENILLGTQRKTRIPAAKQGRLFFADVADWRQVDEAIKTASPESQADMARWDPAGRGFTWETVSYDLANLTSRAFDQARRARTGLDRMGPFETVPVEIWVGDFDFHLLAFQKRRGDDIGLQVSKVTPREAEPLPDVMVSAVRAGRPFLVIQDDGTMVDVSGLARAPKSGRLV